MHLLHQTWTATAYEDGGLFCFYLYFNSHWGSNQDTGFCLCASYWTCLHQLNSPGLFKWKLFSLRAPQNTCRALHSAMTLTLEDIKYLNTVLYPAATGGQCVCWPLNHLAEQANKYATLLYSQLARVLTLILCGVTIKPLHPKHFCLLLNLCWFTSLDSVATRDHIYLHCQSFS